MNKKVIIIVSILAILLIVGVGVFLFTGKKESAGFNKNIQNENKKKGTGSTDLDSSKVLVVYFSETGNTKQIAERLSKELSADMIELEPVVPYSKNYDEVVKVGQEEVERGYQPELKPLTVDVNHYERIIVGTPTWWYKMASPVLTFLSENDFSGKIVVPFMTNAGWKGSVIKDMTELCKNAKVENAKETKFNEDILVTPEEKLEKWIESLK